MNKLSKQFLKFCLVGVFATVINYGIFYLLINVFDFNYMLSSSVGFLSGVVAGFPFNKSWTFKSKNDDWSKQILLYGMVYTLSLILSLIFLKIQVEYLGLDPKIANIFCICLTTLTNFMGTKLFIFKT